MRIEPFGVEIWMNAWETRCRYNLAETCAWSLSIGELLGIASMAPGDLEAMLRPMRLTYGAIEGSDRLRAAIAGLYASVPAERVVVTHGAIGANALVHQALVGPGDIVVSVVPTYQQHTSIPESLGAEVRRVWLHEAQGWRLDLDELRRAVGGRASLIALANPNNPSGALLDEATLREIAAIAEAADARVLVDEVYRGLDQADPGTTASIADLSPRGIAVGSMSKAFSMAGLRLGWIAAPDEVLRRVSVHRDYSTISVSMVDDLLASIALEHRDVILDRNRALVRANLATLDAWVAGEPSITYVRPAGGTTALLRYAAPLASEDLCVRLLEAEGVMYTPGSALGVEGTIRIGYANDPAVLAAGLDRTSAVLAMLPV
jgi:aspartate/methionine/tyrosine aminotransferase